MKKILYWGPYSGHVGTIKAQINSAYAMRKYGGYDVMLVRAHSEFGGMEKELQEKGIRLFDLGLSKFFPGLERSAIFARRPYMLIVAVLGFFPLAFAMRKEKPDMIILNLLVLPALIAIKASSISTSIVISVQGYPHFLGVEGESVPVWKRIENRVRKFLWNRFFPQADFVLTMTERTRKQLVKFTLLRSSQVRVMHNPVVDSMVLSGKSQPAPHGWFHQEIPVLIGVGRLTRQKGFDVLIDAVSKVRDSGLSVNLLIVGEGEDRSKLQRQINNCNLTNSVNLLGHLNNPYPYIAHCDLFVLSSRWEDPGHAVIEAAALDVPILTTDCPSGPSDLIGKGAGGWVCKNGDSDDMARNIIDALKNPSVEKTLVSSKNADLYTLNSHYKSLNSLFEANTS